MVKKLVGVLFGLVFVVVLILYGVFLFNNDENDFSCYNVNFDLTSENEYVSCSVDEDCFSEACGCVNGEGVRAFEYLTKECGVVLKCLPPESCSCIAEKCSDSGKGIYLVLDKMSYGVSEEVNLKVVNNYDEDVQFYTVEVERIEDNSGVAVRTLDCPCGSECQWGLREILAGDSFDYTWDGKVIGEDGVSCGITIPGRYRFSIKNVEFVDSEEDISMNNYYSDIFEIAE